MAWDWNGVESPPHTPRVVDVGADAELSRCQRLRSFERDPAQPWRPFRVPEEVRVWVLPAPARGEPRARHPATRAQPDGHGRHRRLLLIDDREPYRRISLAWFHAAQHFHCEVVATAAEGLALLAHRGPAYYDMLVSDVSMEYELAGLYATRLWRRLGFTGIGVLSSTGFDNFFGLLAARLCLGPVSAVDWLIPKTSLKLGSPRYVRCRSVF